MTTATTKRTQKKPKPPCGANTPVKLGDLFLLLKRAGEHEIAATVMERILYLDQNATAE